MLWIVIVMLVVLWLLGLVVSALPGLINILLVVAAAMLIYKLLAGRRPA